MKKLIENAKAIVPTVLALAFIFAYYKSVQETGDTRFWVADLVSGAAILCVFADFLGAAWDGFMGKPCKSFFGEAIENLTGHPVIALLAAALFACGIIDIIG